MVPNGERQLAEALKNEGNTLFAQGNLKAAIEVEARRACAQRHHALNRGLPQMHGMARLVLLSITSLLFPSQKYSEALQHDNWPGARGRRTGLLVLGQQRGTNGERCELPGKDYNFCTKRLAWAITGLQGGLRGPPSSCHRAWARCPTRGCTNFFRTSS